MPTANYLSLHDKHIFITGGASGIGAALVEAFTAQNCRVFFVDIDDTSADILVRKLQAVGRAPLYRRCDLRDVTQIDSAIDEAVRTFGPIHCLINNAALDDRHQIEEVSVDYWDKCQNINLRPHFFTAQKACESMKANGGSIINMSSTSFMLKIGGMPAYLTAKAGIVGLTRALARDLGPHDIRVNALLPGWVMTQRQKDLWLTPEAEVELLEGQCIKRKIEPEDVAKLALFLASSDSEMISAQSLVIDGGIT
jgi:NAD(P)-dependent dehydrogenase (short-subunit alcohol dehydrogenase family)